MQHRGMKLLVATAKSKAKQGNQYKKKTICDAFAIAVVVVDLTFIIVLQCFGQWNGYYDTVSGTNP